MVDQSLINAIGENHASGMLPAITGLTNSHLNNDNNIIEFGICLNKLVTSPSTSSTTSLARFNKNNTNKNSEANNVLTEFENKFRSNFPQLYQELCKQMKQFVEKFLEALKRDDQLVSNSNKQNEIVQEFFKKIYKYIATSGSLKSYIERSAQVRAHNSNDHSENQQQVDESQKLNEAIMILVESYVTNNIYDHVFPIIMSEFEEQDMNLQKRIRDFYWITNEMIGTCIDENSIFYRDSYEEALNCKYYIH